ncbi:MAG: hypothetical protein HAW67_05885, partial [Endozoicomonadaceae bacterium]|nr:hypothetical protein [Endozoicomonadaceae bacterium]
MLFQEKNAIARLYKEFSFNADTKTSTLLLLLLVTDCIFVILHFVALIPAFDNPLLGINKDQGYAEIYMYLKELWIIILFIFILIKTKTVGYIGWTLLFIYILLDDSLQIHETLGGYLAAQLEFSSLLGLRPQDFGELTVSALSSAILLGLLLIFYITSSSAFKNVTQNVFLLLLLLAFFGIFIDMLDMMIKLGWKVDYIFAAIEDGGELIVMSLLLYYIYLVKIRI